MLRRPVASLPFAPPVLAVLLTTACSVDDDYFPPIPQAGFILVPPAEYTVRGGATSLTATTSAARFFVSFQPADSNYVPLVVMHSGGPGASTAILLAGNTAPVTLDPARTGGEMATHGPASWTSFAHMLYVDARGTGFSYGIADGMEDEAARAAEFTVRNFNTFVDAADLVRVVLRFVREAPSLRATPIVFAGESYAGIRTSIALHMLHHPERYGAGAEPYEDVALVAQIESHFAAAGTTAEEQFGRAILLQPRLSSPHQQAAAGAALEAPGSVLSQVAGETGVPFVPCSDQPAPCSAFANVVDYLAEAGRDLYDVRRPAGATFARYEEIGARIEDPGGFQKAIGVPSEDVPWLGPENRENAYRLIEASPGEERLDAWLGGEIAPYDRYFEIELFDLIGAPFAGAEAQSLGIERQSERHGLYFLEDALAVRFFVTNAAYDAAIWTPSLPDALAMYTDEVAGVHTDGDELTIEYHPGAFAGPETSQTSRPVRFVPYEAAGHSVSLDMPRKLATDVRAWLAE